MIYKALTIITFLISANFLFSQETQTVKIGNQYWTTKNLNVDKFQNGDNIPQATTLEEWRKANNLKQPIWCYYNFNSEYGKNHGKLYNWYAVNDSRGLAPKGFRIPTKRDIYDLDKYLSNAYGDDVSNQKFLKSNSGWELNGGNATGFNAIHTGSIVPSERMENEKYFDNLPQFTFTDLNNNKSATWWTSSTNRIPTGKYGYIMKNAAIAYSLDDDPIMMSISIMDSGFVHRVTGHSVRCIKID